MAHSAPSRRRAQRAPKAAAWWVGLGAVAVLAASPARAQKLPPSADSGSHAEAGRPANVEVERPAPRPLPEEGPIDGAAARAHPRAESAEDPPPPTPGTRVDETTGQPLTYTPARFDLNPEGTQWIRFVTLLQVWARGQELNPGTLVDGSPQSATGDVGVRRARLLVVGQPFPRVRVLLHVGMNNQSFVSAPRPEFYVHDAWTDFEVIADGILWMGGGLHYWNGVSRMANASTLNLLGLDAPISNWFTLERTDQFARQLGLFAHGQIEALDYRLAFNRPFTPSTALAAPEDGNAGAVDYRPDADTVSFAGYVQVQLIERESQVLPYTVGTYLGSKTVLNLGAGFYWHPDALGHLAPTPTGEPRLHTHDQTHVGVDVFLDLPSGGGSALTVYASYTFSDLGPGFVRNVGIMNLASGVDPAAASFNGGGNAYPLMGSGHAVFAQAGFLLPGRLAEHLQVQPYVSVQLAALDALADPAVLLEGGVNWLVFGHHARITTHYRGRPVFTNEAGAVRFERYASEGILQLHVFF